MVVVRVVVVVEELYMEGVCSHCQLKSVRLVIHEYIPQLPDLSVPINKNKRTKTMIKYKNTKKSPPAMVGWWALSNVSLSQWHYPDTPRQKGARFVYDSTILYK